MPEIITMPLFRKEQRRTGASGETVSALIMLHLRKKYSWNFLVRTLESRNPGFEGQAS